MAYDSLLRPWMLDWGVSAEERKMPLRGDEALEEVMTDHARGITIDARPETVSLWLVQLTTPGGQPLGSLCIASRNREGGPRPLRH